MTDNVENTEETVAKSDTAEEVELEALRAENEDLIDTLQRVKADFDNFRKRAARDQEALVARAGERIVKELLPVLDDLERVLEAAKRPEAPVRDSRPKEGVGGNRVEVPPTDSVLSDLEEGVKLVHRQLEQLLVREGLAPVATDGKFDPHVHEALLTQPSASEEGSVIEVLQKGYRLGDRVLRPARVVVAGPKEEPSGDES
jgi:molecular chaperone GrpE